MTLAPRGTMPPILRGMLLIARGRPEGLNCFRDTPRAYVFSLATGIGILFGAVIQGIAEGSVSKALSEIPGTLCVLLAPSVLSFELARLWGREAFWYRYIVAFNWCQWLLPMIGFLMIVALTMARLGGVAGQGALRLLLVGLAVYAMWLNWFLARHGLALTVGRAALLVIAVNVGTLALVFIPSMLATHFE